MSSELDLRGLHRAHDPDPAFVDRLRQQLEDIASGAVDAPEPVEVVELPLGPPLRAGRPGRRRLVLAAAVVVVLAASSAVLWDRFGDADDTTYAGGAASAFVGSWVSTDLDGSSQTLEILDPDGRGYEIVLRDDQAGVCGAASSTMTGAALLEADGSLVVARPEFACDDGTSPSLDALLADFTFVHLPATGELRDSTGVVWRRVGADDARPPVASGTMWPQSNLDEVREAQRLADAGDPDTSWQVDPTLGADDLYEGRTSEIFARFVTEELGWETFRFLGIEGEYNTDDTYGGVQFIRCAPGETNPLYPADPQGGGCAPTIDELRYERVQIDVARRGRQGPTGIWVVHRWAIVEPFAQAAPPSDAEARTLLRDFLQARVAGEGAEAYLWGGEGLPLLYATTTGAPYERFEIAPLDDEPEWPMGERVFRVRLFAQGGSTVVEQLLAMARREGPRLLLSASTGDPDPSIGSLTENGRPVAESYRFLGGEVTFSAPWPWSCCGSFDYNSGPTLSTLYLDSQGEGLALVADPVPVGSSCQVGPPPADAEALARAIGADPDLETTEPLAVRVAGVQAWQLDVRAAAGATVCDGAGPAVVLTEGSTPADPKGVWGEQVRVYLLDMPGGSARVLAVAVFALDTGFERVVQAAAPILESLAFETG